MRDVGGQQDGAAAFRQGRAQSGRIDIGMIDRDDAGAAPGEQAGGGATDEAGGTGDDGDLAVQASPRLRCSSVPPPALTPITLCAIGGLRRVDPVEVYDSVRVGATGTS